MENELNLKGNSDSCVNLGPPKPSSVPHSGNASAEQSQRDLMPAGGTTNCEDMSPGSSRNCCQYLHLPIGGDHCDNQIPWFLKKSDSFSLHSCDSMVCRICHNSENPEKLVSPCLCKGSLTYVHLHCLERWISTSRCTTCELCQFQYDTQQTLRYSLFQSLRIWYSRSMSRRALREDCQMFSLLTLVAFGIIGTLMVAVQYYILQGHLTGVGRLWTKGWLIFFLITTLVVYFINVYMIAKTQLSPWYRWWQSARDIHLILENHKPFHSEQLRRQQQSQPQPQSGLNRNELSSLPPPQTSIDLESNASNSDSQPLALDSDGIVAPDSSDLAAASPAVECNNEAKTPMSMSVLVTPSSTVANYDDIPDGAAPAKDNKNEHARNKGADVATTST